MIQAFILALPAIALLAIGFSVVSGFRLLDQHLAGSKGSSPRRS